MGKVEIDENGVGIIKYPNVDSRDILMCHYVRIEGDALEEIRKGFPGMRIFLLNVGDTPESSVGDVLVYGGFLPGWEACALTSDASKKWWWPFGNQGSSWRSVEDMKEDWEYGSQPYWFERWRSSPEFDEAPLEVA